MIQMTTHKFQEGRSKYTTEVVIGMKVGGGGEAYW